MRPMVPFRFLACLGLALAASCSGGSAPSSSAKLHVALLSPGPVNDNGWNASAYEGLLRIEKELGAKKSQQQVKNPSEFEEGYRSNARAGATLIFGHGFEFGDAALKVGKEFPGTKFLVSAGAPGVHSENVASMVWRVEDAAYLCGRIAAALSKTGKAGCVGGEDIPPVRSAFDAFEQGAKLGNPNFEVRQVYVGNWHDIGAARAQTLALIEAGCDVLFHDADAAGLGMLEAAEQKGVFAFGCTKDQSSSAPNAVVASAVTDVPKSFVEIAREIQEGRFRGRRIEWTRKEGMVGIVWNPAMKAKVPAEVLQQVEELDSKIASGSLKIPYSAQ